MAIELTTRAGARPRALPLPQHPPHGALQGCHQNDVEKLSFLYPAPQAFVTPAHPSRNGGDCCEQLPGAALHSFKVCQSWHVPTATFAAVPAGLGAGAGAQEFAAGSSGVQSLLRKGPAVHGLAVVRPPRRLRRRQGAHLRSDSSPVLI